MSRIMEITYLGHSSFRLKGKSAVVVTDHNVVKLVSSEFVVDGPGEYEVEGVSIVGIHSEGVNTMYVIEIDGLRMAHLGGLEHKLTQEQLEELGAIDVVMVAVGNIAVEVVKQIDPWIAIPMAELPDAGEFLREMGKPDVVPVPKLVISADRMPTELQVVVLERK